MKQEPYMAPDEFFNNIQKNHITNLTKEKRDVSYYNFYYHIINFFKEKETLSEQDFFIGAHIVYGWMPTMLQFNRDGDFSLIITSLNKLKENGTITDNEITNIRDLIKNSYIGTSKLIHFICPENFPIWDSRVYKAYTGKGKLRVNYTKINNDLSLYRNYISFSKMIIQDNQFSEIHKQVEKQINHNVTAMRALELIMFHNQDIKKGGS